MFINFQATQSFHLIPNLCSKSPNIKKTQKKPDLSNNYYIVKYLSNLHKQHQLTPVNSRLFSEFDNTYQISRYYLHKKHYKILKKRLFYVVYGILSE